MTPPSPIVTNDQLLAEVREIKYSLEMHIATDAATGKKTDILYEKIVTGNGTPSLMERVRTIEGVVGKMPAPSRVEDLEKWKSNVTWALGLMIATLVVSFANSLIQIWKSIP